MIKNKKIIISLIVIGLIIISVIGVLLNNQKHPMQTTSYNKVIKKIDKKKTFNILITDKETSDLRPVLNYYENVYDIDVDYLDLDPKDAKFNEFMKKVSIDFPPSLKSIFITVKDGKITGSIMGWFNESNIKDLLVESKTIGKEYKDIDTVIIKNLKSYSKEPYTILYINKDNKDLYKYRELLVKNKIKSVILYPGTGEIKEVKAIEKELGFDRNVNDKLPTLIKIKNKKVLYYYSNIKLDDLVKKAKLYN